MIVYKLISLPLKGAQPSLAMYRRFFSIVPRNVRDFHTHGCKVKWQKAKPQETAITEARQSSAVGEATLGERVRETTKMASYTGVILLGVGVTGIMFYAIFSELFSSKSPNRVYAKALDQVMKDPQIQDALGENIRGFGEETRRGRRRHTSHLEYVQDGVNHMRMKFYVKGSRARATVHLEVQEDDTGKYQYRYLFVQMDDFPRRTFIIEDNR